MFGNMARPGRRTFSTGRIAVLAVVLAGAGFGCGATRTSSPFVSQADARINIQVVNRNYQQITLYAVWPGRRVRLGTINGTGEANYMLPWDGTYLLQIEIDPLASPDCITEPIWADAGDIILLEIQPRIRIGIDCF